MANTKWKLRNMGDKVRRSNICLTRVPGAKGTEEILKEKVAENFLELKDSTPQTEGTQ